MENKKFFSKDNIFLWVCTILIGIIVLLCVLGSYADYITNKESEDTYIILNDDIYNKSYYVNSDNELVSSNLINQPNMYLDDFSWSSFNIVENEYYWVSFDVINNSSFNYNSFELYISLDDDYFDVVNNGHGRFIGGFVANSTGATSLSFEGYSTDTDVLIQNIMVNTGSSALGYETFGAIWYDTSDIQLQELLNAYKSSSNAFDVSNFLNQKVLINGVDVTSQYGNSWCLDNYNSGLAFLNSEFSSYSSWRSSGLNDVSCVINMNKLYFVSAISLYSYLPHSADNYVTFDFYYNGSLSFSSGSLDSDNSLSSPLVSNTSFLFNKIILSASISEPVSYNQWNGFYQLQDFSTGFNVGYNEASQFYEEQNTILNNQVNSLNDQIQNLNNELSDLSNQNISIESNYNSLLEQYNALLNSSEFSFSELFWSISAVPFGVLTSGFNVNVMGVSLASIITGLFTAMLIIWLFKKLL